MTYKNFEDYLHEIHAKHYTGTDDHMSGAFGLWLKNLHVDVLMIYADAYGEIKKLEGFDMAGNIIKNI